MNQLMEFDQIRKDILGLGKEVISFWCPLFHFQGHTWHFETQILIEKSLCAHYILEFYLTSTDTSLGHGKEVIRFL